MRFLRPVRFDYLPVDIYLNNPVIPPCARAMFTDFVIREVLQEVIVLIPASFVPWIGFDSKLVVRYLQFIPESAKQALIVGVPDGPIVSHSIAGNSQSVQLMEIPRPDLVCHLFNGPALHFDFINLVRVWYTVIP